MWGGLNTWRPVEWGPRAEFREENCGAVEKRRVEREEEGYRNHVGCEFIRALWRNSKMKKPPTK